jgi:hypothetical protein
MIILLIPFLVLLLGWYLYYWTTNPKTQEMGRICFEVGLFVTLFRMTVDVIKLFNRG